MESSLNRALCLALAILATATVGGCQNDDTEAALETLDELVSRVAPQRGRGPVTFVPEPTSYRVEYDLYVRGHTEGEVAGSGDERRRRLDATRLLRSVVRPFTASGAARRTLGFVREAGGGTSRVTHVRPLADDPRPHVYPPPPATTYRRIAGRVCASHRIGRDEYCIDERGIVLLTHTANSVEVVTDVSIGHETRNAEELAAPLARGFSNRERGSIRPVDPTTAPAGATDYSLNTPPPGFSLVGRYATVPLTGELLKPNSSKVIAGIVDVYVRGSDGVVVDRGGKLDQSQVGPEDLGTLIDARDVDLGAIGMGQVGVGGFGPFGYREVRATMAGGRYVVVAGTLPEDHLVAIARALRPLPGTELRYLDR